MKIKAEVRAGRPSANRTPHEALLCLWLLAAGLPVAVLGQANYATPYTFTTLAGHTRPANWDGTGSAAQFDYPQGIAVDTNGNVFVADQSNHTIRKVTPAGLATTLAGSAGDLGSTDGTGSAARFNYPWAVALDSAGNLYVGDWGNNTIRKVTPVGTDWVVTTLAGLAGIAGSTDGTGTNALFHFPWGVAVDIAGNVYVADGNNYDIRKRYPRTRDYLLRARFRVHGRTVRLCSLVTIGTVGGRRRFDGFAELAAPLDQHAHLPGLSYV
jgi:hypothetical protein